MRLPLHYDDIEHIRIRKVVTTHIPALMAQLKPLIRLPLCTR